MIDGSVIKVHQDAMRSGYPKDEEAIGKSVGGLSSKIHAKVDSFGQLMTIRLTAGQVHESQVAHELFAKESCGFLLADKAYDIDSFRQSLEQQDIEPVIPSKINRLNPKSHDGHIYKRKKHCRTFFSKD